MEEKMKKNSIPVLYETIVELLQAGMQREEIIQTLDSHIQIIQETIAKKAKSTKEKQLEEQVTRLIDNVLGKGGADENDVAFIINQYLPTTGDFYTFIKELCELAGAPMIVVKGTDIKDSLKAITAALPLLKNQIATIISKDFSF